MVWRAEHIPLRLFMFIIVYHCDFVHKAAMIAKEEEEQKKEAGEKKMRIEAYKEKKKQEQLVWLYYIPCV